MGNRKGFIGSSANSYFLKVHETIQSAERALGKGQDMIKSTAKVEEQNENYSPKNQMDNHLRSIDINEFVPGSYVSQYEKNVDKLYDSLSSSAVSSDDDLYRYVSDKNLKCDEEIANKLMYAIQEMENVLSNHLQVPTATPKIEEILKEVKNSLSESSRLSNEQSKEMTKYERGVIQIDESGSTRQWPVDLN